MANHCFYHFSQKITLDEVEASIRFYCRERLGDESLFSRDEDFLYVKIPVELGHDAHTCFWLKNNKTLEHRHPHFGFDFGVKIAEFIAWQLKATYGKDEGIEEKISCNNFLSNPTIKFDNLLDVFGDGLPLKILKKITPRIKSKYINEDNLVTDLNNKCAFYYNNPNKSYFNLELENKFKKRVQQIIHHKNKDETDIFFGNPLRAAICKSNYQLANILIDNDFKLTDTIDFSGIKKPIYITDNYLNTINIPIISLAINTLNSQSNSQEVSKLISKMMKNGADPFIKDSRGLDSLDTLFLTRVLSKNQNIHIFQAFSENIESRILKQKINDSDLSDMKKEIYLSCLKTFNSKNLKIK